MKIVLRRPGIVIVAALTAITALLGIKTTPAHAATGGFCVEEASYNQCLNDWNNGGPSNSNEIRLYPVNNPNEDFQEQSVPGRCGGHVTVSPPCPFTNSYFDNYYKSYPVFQLQYNGGKYCLATGSAADGTSSAGVLGQCNNTSKGSGGSN